MNKLLTCIFVITTIIYGCNEGNEDEPTDKLEQLDIVPGSITNLKAEAGDSTVTLTWVNPNDDNIKQIEVRYDNQVIVLQHNQSQCVIGKLTNFRDYHFEIVRISNRGQSSDGISVSTMPFLAFRIVEAMAVQSGRYKNANGQKELSIDMDNNFSRTNNANMMLYKLSGNIQCPISGEVVLDGVFSTYEHSADNEKLNIISFNKEFYSNALTLHLSNGTYIGFGWLEKVSGSEAQIEGKYVAYKHSNGEFPNYETNEEITLTIDKNGVWKKSYIKTTNDSEDSSTNSEEQGIITDSDIRTGKYYLLKHNGRCFLNINLELYKRVEAQ